ncbi:MAG: class I SAM-dependent methyltransferase [Candidatus Micrarchaeota archaeon]
MTRNRTLCNTPVHATSRSYVNLRSSDKIELLRKGLGKKLLVDVNLANLVRDLSATPEGKRELLKAYYDHVSGNLDQVFGVETAHYVALYQAISGSRYFFEGNIRILDPSCGTGELASILLGKVWRDVNDSSINGPFITPANPPELVLSDLSGRMVVRTKQKIRGLLNRRKEMRRRIHMEQKDLYTYNPQEDGKFDIVMMSQSLPFLTDQEHALKIVFDILKQGGRFFLIEEDHFVISSGTSISPYKFIYDIISPPSNRNPPDVIRHMAEQVGFISRNRVTAQIDSDHSFCAHSFLRP